MSAPSSPKFNSRQMDRAVKKMRDKKEARQKAKDEEENYLEYRKRVILASTAPRVGTLRSGDDAFPKRRRGISMGFGERKAHFLSIRPNPKYASWFGRKKGVISAKPKVVTPTAAQLTDHSNMPDKPLKIDEQPGVKSSESEAKVGTSGSKTTTSIETPTKDSRPTSGEKHGNRADNPLDANGQPFWLAMAGEADEITDDDLPVDMEVLEKVCNGEMQLHQKPHQKLYFNPYGPVQRLKFDDTLFVREQTLFTTTVEAVIALQPDDAVQYPVIGAPKPVIRWVDKVKIVIYDPTDRERKLSEIVFEDLKDVRREKK